MTDKSNTYSIPFLLALFLSVLFVTFALGILIWSLGWGVLLVLGAAFVVFVVLSIARDAIQDARARE